MHSASSNFLVGAAADARRPSLVAIFPAITIARWFILQRNDDGLPSTHRQIQALLFYAEGFHQALHGVALFNEPIELGPEGPVLMSVASEYAQFKQGPLPNRAGGILLDVKAASTLRKVYSVYGMINEDALFSQLDREALVKNTASQFGLRPVINKMDLMRCFKGRLDL